MKLVFEGRVLIHRVYTGVENYANNILINLKNKMEIKIAKPKTYNKYLSHLWTQFILPFHSGDIIFCPANIAPCFVPSSKRLIVTIHDLAFITYSDSFSKFFRIYYKLMVPLIIKRADKIITVSNYSKKEIEQYYPNARGKVVVISLGYNLNFKTLENIKIKKQILYVGSLNERKNFISVIKAFEIMNNKHYKLLIVGNFSSTFSLSDETQLILKKAKMNQNIEFVQGVSDDGLIKLYNESTVLIFPSFYEGFGLPVLESMACGTPVICSNTTSLPEVGGDAAVYCDPNNIEDIKNKIEIVLNNKELQNNMRDKGLLRAKLFSWEKSAQMHLEVFKEVLER